MPELLTVLSIVAVLLALLVPVVSGARRSAIRTTCLSNLRQLATSYRSYVMENGGQSFEYSWTEDYCWMQLLQPYCGTFEKVGTCPAATDPSGWSGSASEKWGPGVNGHSGSYGVNGWICRCDLPANPIALWGSYSCGPLSEYIYNLGTDPTRVPVFSDSIWPDGWPMSTDFVPSNLQTPPLDWGGCMSRVCTSRHQNVTNVVFVDGHGETMPLANLWNLHWSMNFKPTTVYVPSPAD